MLTSFPLSHRHFFLFLILQRLYFTFSSNILSLVILSHSVTINHSPLPPFLFLFSFSLQNTYFFFLLYFHDEIQRKGRLIFNTRNATQQLTNKLTHIKKKKKFSFQKLRTILPIKRQKVSYLFQVPSDLFFRT